jgi:hypothetical protein
MATEKKLLINKRKIKMPTPAITHNKDPLGAQINLIQSSAKDYGGQCTFKFSQCLPPVSTLIGMHRTTSGGVCQALSTKWMVEHAKDSSLWEWLYKNGTLDNGGMYNVMINFADNIIQRMGQMAASDKYLQMHGLKKRQNIVTGDAVDMWSTTRKSARGGKGSIGRRLVSAIQKTDKNTSGNYVLLGMDGDGGHAMCAWIAQDACFFDPNCGEFYFANKADFYKWLPLLTQLLGYDQYWKAQAVAYAKG